MSVTPRLHQQLDVHGEEHVVVERDALDGGVVGADRGDVVVVDERHRVDTETGLREVVGAGGEEVEPAGAHEQDVAGAHLGALRVDARVELGARDHVTGLEPVDALVPGQVEQDAAAGERAGGADVAVRRAALAAELVARGSRCRCRLR